MNSNELTGQLHTKWAARSLVFLEKTPSTQDAARKACFEGAPHGALYITGNQTTGRGRMGRSWICPPDVNIAMTILLRPAVSLELAPMITLIMGLSVAEAISGMLPPDAPGALIKWPNDIVIDGKKVCGILTETVTLPDGSYACLVGTGINVHQRAFPEELSDIAGSIYTQTGGDIKRALLAALICDRFEINYEEFESEGSLSPVSKRYEDRLVNTGKTVKIMEASGAYEAEALGIDPENGALFVKPADGTIRRINAGEVSVRGLYGYT
ncbi:MAG: biotin--[acetyl-CoA-carboxylase] ligase [Lachnospiraceae bacterium]|nr:biotin--[acetyl-CoA-carboxylase] ligase [Lachnospiraceae bacterium]